MVIAENSRTDLRPILRLDRVATGKEVARWEGHRLRIEEIAFSPDGTHLATAGDDTTARVWRIFATTLDLQNQAKQSAPRCLPRKQLGSSLLASSVPGWCITGPGRASERDPAAWQPKWPYDTAGWKQWLVDRRAGNNPPTPP